MKYYAVLFITTALLIFFGERLWARTRSVSFPLGLAFLYYWTLQGAWVLVHDRLANASNAAYHYSGYEERLFPILLDSSYLEALLIYSLFLVVISAALFLLVRRPEPSHSRVYKLAIVHWKLLGIAIASGAASYWIVRGALATAISRDLPEYEFTRQVFSENPMFTAHQILNRIALFAVCFGLCVCFSGTKGRYVIAKRSTAVMLLYIAVLFGLGYFMSLLGNRSELVFAGLAAILFYLINVPRSRLVVAGIAFAVVMLGANFIYQIRGGTEAERAEAAESFDPAGVLDFLRTSNEQFVAHFSLYGVIKNEVSLTYGSSIVSLASSIVPRALWADRPNTIYEHYAEAIKAAPGQGYTIHHATGWYLNFGVAGVVLGAIVLALLWARLFNWFHEPDSSNHFLQAAKVLAVWTYVANLPSLVRAGPEGYKSCVFEAILIPAAIVAVSVTRATSPSMRMAAASRNALGPKTNLSTYPTQ